MMMASFFLLFRERKKKFLFVNDGKRKRAQGNARNLSASAAFWASGGFWANLFFFLPFRFKKSSPFLWWEIAQSQTDTRAPSFRLFRTKNSLFISIHKFYIALVEHT